MGVVIPHPSSRLQVAPMVRYWIGELAVAVIAIPLTPTSWTWQVGVPPDCDIIGGAADKWRTTHPPQPTREQALADARLFLYDHCQPRTDAELAGR